MAFDYAYLRYGDSNYAHTVNQANRQLHHSPACYFPTQVYEQLPEVPVRGQRSTVFDKLGYAILRGRDGGGETFLLMDYGPHGGVHGHPDKLNLVLFADGDELAGEPQSYRYEDDRHRNWTRPTIAHWTLSVDEHSQNPTAGRLVCFADDGDVKVVRGQAAGAYAGVALDRTVVQLPGYLVDVYRAWGPAVHTFDYPLCFRGELDRLQGISSEELRPMASVTPGYRHLRVAPSELKSGRWRGVWRRDAAGPNPEAESGDARRGGPASRVSATLLPGASATRAWVGAVAGGRHQAVIRRVGRDVTFACVVDPFRATDAVKSAQVVELRGPVSGTAARVTRAGGGVDWIVVRYDPMADGAAAGASTFERFTTRALVTVIRLDASGAQIDRLDVGGAGKREGRKP